MLVLHDSSPHAQAVAGQPRHARYGDIKRTFIRKQ